MNRQVDSEAAPTTRQPFDAARSAAAEKYLWETNYAAAAAAQQMKEGSSFAMEQQDMMAMDKRTGNKEQKEKERAFAAQQMKEGTWSETSQRHSTKFDVS